MERGVLAGRSFAFLATYCEAWLQSMQMYRERLPEDWWPFDYGERPLVGFLAAGITRSQGLCIEEFWAEKKASAARRRRPTYPGRADLYFLHRGPRGNDREGNIEFKVHDVGISKTYHFDRFLEKNRRIGEADANRPRDRTVPRYYGMFVRPYVGSERDIDRYNDNIRLLLNKAREKVNPDVLAWWCPTNEVLATQAEDTKGWRVGVILLLKQVK